MNRFLGYHDSESLPIKRGDTIVIPKGVTVRSMHPQRDKPYVTKRAQRVKVFSIGSGSSVTHYRPGGGHERVPTANPTVEWAGSGGYWCWVDINDILAANGLE